MTQTSPMERRAAIPTSSIDPFSLDFLRDPHPAHEKLREAGPVVWLDAYGCYAVARHAEVREMLNDPGDILLEARGGPQRFCAREAVAAAKPCAGDGSTRA